jgi:hypothetical protein
MTLYTVTEIYLQPSHLQAYVYTPAAQSLHYCIHTSHYVRSAVSELKTKMHQQTLVASMT